MKRLLTCPYCGRKESVAHTKYDDRCEECGKRYKNFTNYRSRNKKRYNGKRDAKLVDIIDEYKALQRRGFKVPKVLEEYK